MSQEPHGLDGDAIGERNARQVQNALEHAFVGRDRGCVAVSLRQSAAELTIEVRDDGIGLSDDSPRHLGLEIVETLVLEDLNGSWSLRGDGGTVARIAIPIA